MLRQPCTNTHSYIHRARENLCPCECVCATTRERERERAKEDAAKNSPAKQAKPQQQHHPQGNSSKTSVTRSWLLHIAVAAAVRICVLISKRLIRWVVCRRPPQAEKGRAKDPCVSATVLSKVSPSVVGRKSSECRLLVRCGLSLRLRGVIVVLFGCLAAVIGTLLEWKKSNFSR